MADPLALEIGAGLRPVRDTGWEHPGDTARFSFVLLDLYSPANIRWDFNRVPYPFRDSVFSAIFARHTLEHVRLGSIIDVMREIHRIARPGALVYIRVPYWNSKAFAQDPTHQTRFTEDTFYHFCGMMGTEHYIPKLFDLVEIEHRFHPKLWFIPRFAKLKLMNLMSEVCTEMWVTLRVAKAPEGVDREPGTRGGSPVPPMVGNRDAAPPPVGFDPAGSAAVTPSPRGSREAGQPPRNADQGAGPRGR